MIAHGEGESNALTGISLTRLCTNRLTARFSILGEYPSERRKRRTRPHDHSD